MRLQYGGLLVLIDAGQRFDAARSVALNRKRLLVSGGIPVVFAPFEHEEDGTQDFVRQSFDRKRKLFDDQLQHRQKKASLTP